MTMNIHRTGGDLGVVGAVSYHDLLKTYGNRVDLSKLEKSATLVRTASASERVAPRESDFLYIRDRAVSAGNVIVHKDGCEVVPTETMYADFAHYGPIVRGANANGDFWSVDELRKNGQTFIGKSVFVDHDNTSVERARGIILDAIYNEKWHYVEVLEAIDKVAFPQLATAIQKRYVTGTSMGCMVERARCSICGNVVDLQHDQLCEHVANYKGMTLNGLPVWEDNENCEFFENSVVVTPADSDARIMQIVAAKGCNKVFHGVNSLTADQRAACAHEVNQRTAAGKKQTIADQLANLPWS